VGGSRKGVEDLGPALGSIPGMNANTPIVGFNNRNPATRVLTAAADSPDHTRTNSHLTPHVCHGERASVLHDLDPSTPQCNGHRKDRANDPQQPSDQGNSPREERVATEPEPDSNSAEIRNDNLSNNGSAPPHRTHPPTSSIELATSHRKPKSSAPATVMSLTTSLLRISRGSRSQKASTDPPVARPTTANMPSMEASREAPVQSARLPPGHSPLSEAIVPTSSTPSATANPIHVEPAEAMHAARAAPVSGESLYRQANRPTAIGAAATADRQLSPQSYPTSPLYV
jgi:hypothetical protein